MALFPIYHHYAHSLCATVPLSLSLSHTLTLTFSHPSLRRMKHLEAIHGDSATVPLCLSLSLTLTLSHPSLWQMKYPEAIHGDWKKGSQVSQIRNSNPAVRERKWPAIWVGRSESRNARWGSDPSNYDYVSIQKYGKPKRTIVIVDYCNISYMV